MEKFQREATLLFLEDGAVGEGDLKGPVRVGDDEGHLPHAPEGEAPRTHGGLEAALGEPLLGVPVGTVLG